MNDYLYDVDEAQYSFVRVPKLLLQHEAYQRISSEAKLLYSLLLDRVGLSHKNGWRDKQNRIYIIYPIAEVMEEMNCGKNKAVQLLDELEQKAGLIERKRQGLGKPNLIYVKSFSRTVDNFGERHFLKFENQTSGGLNIKPQEVSESNPTNTDNKKTDMNQTDLSFLPGRESKRNDAYAQYEAYFREELEMTAAFNEYSQIALRREERPSVLEQLRKIKAAILALPGRVINRDRQREQTR